MTQEWMNGKSLAEKISNKITDSQEDRMVIKFARKPKLMNLDEVMRLMWQAINNLPDEAPEWGKTAEAYQHLINIMEERGLKRKRPTVANLHTKGKYKNFWTIEYVTKEEILKIKEETKGQDEALEKLLKEATK
jgi:hypothetical protein